MPIEELNCVEDLATLRAAWAALYLVTPAAVFFQTLDWLLVYWRHFGDSQKLRVLLHREGGKIVGIVPLVVRRERTRLGMLRFLTYPMDYWGSFYGPIAIDPQRTLEAAVAHLRKTRRDWDVLELRFSDSDGAILGSNNAGATADALANAGYASYQTVLDRTSIIDLHDTFDEYLAARGSKYRNNVRRWERKLAEHGEVKHIRFRPDATSDTQSPHPVDARWDLYDACEQVARASWQSTSDDGTTLSSEPIRPFLRDAHTAAVAVGGVDLNLLTIADRPAAFVYNYRGPGGLYSLRVGYTPEFAADGAGNVLYLRVIADSLSRGDRLYDLGPGSFEAKRYIKSREVPIYRHSHYAPLSLRAQIMRVRRRQESRQANSKASPTSAAV